MSLIGRKVGIYVSGGYDGITSAVIEGIILDKYLGIISVRDEEASGIGGTLSATKSKNVDFYIILIKEKVVHTECRNLRYILD